MGAGTMICGVGSGRGLVGGGPIKPSGGPDTPGGAGVGAGAGAGMTGVAEVDVAAIASMAIDSVSADLVRRE